MKKSKVPLKLDQRKEEFQQISTSRHQSIPKYNKEVDQRKIAQSQRKRKNQLYSSSYKNQNNPQAIINGASS